MFGNTQIIVSASKTESALFGLLYRDGNFTKRVKLCEKSLEDLVYVEELDLLISSELRDEAIPCLYFYPKFSRASHTDMPRTYLESLVSQKILLDQTTAIAFPSQKRLLSHIESEIVGVVGEKILLMKVQKECVEIVCQLNAHIQIDSIWVHAFRD